MLCNTLKQEGLLSNQHPLLFKKGSFLQFGYTSCERHNYYIHWTSAGQKCFKVKNKVIPTQKCKNLLFVFSTNQTKTCQAKALLLICENLSQSDVLQRNLGFTLFLPVPGGGGKACCGACFTRCVQAVYIPLLEEEKNSATLLEMGIWQI